MRFVRKPGHLAVPTPLDDDPLSGVANLFDISIALIVALLVAMFGLFSSTSILDPSATVTTVIKTKNGGIEMVTKDKSGIRNATRSRLSTKFRRGSLCSREQIKVTSVGLLFFFALLNVFTCKSPYAQSYSPHPKIAFLFEGTEGVNSALIGKAAASFGDRLTVRSFVLQAGSSTLPTGADLASYDMVIADVSSDSKKMLAPIVEDAKAHTRVIVLGSEADRGNVPLSKPDWPQQYWSNPSVENLINLIRLAENEGLHISSDVTAPPYITRSKRSIILAPLASL